MTITTNSTCAQCGSALRSRDFFCQQCHFPLAQAGMTVTFVKQPSEQANYADQNANLPAAFDSADTAVMLSNVSGQGESAQPASPNNVSSQLPHFKINEVLGFGGMGTVYRAQDLSLGRYVALKLFHCPRLAQSEGHQRLLAEARLACQLNHPNIVTIYDIARGEQTDFFVMEWVDGLPLNKLLPEHGFELLTALDYALQLLDGLACAHKSEIIHRDIKPQNIMVNRSERIKILDFGIASLIQEAKENTTEQMSGTWLYMAPEQLNGEPADARADLFAFGVTFYEMLTGQKPFDGKNPQALLSAITASELKAVSEVKPTLPKALDDILAKLLKADKNERYQNAEQVSHDLAAVQHALTAQKNWWQRRHLATKAVLVLPIIALLGYSLQQVLFPPTTLELVARQLVEAKKIAILPFDNISGDPVLQIFSDGIANMLSTDLAEVGYLQGDGTTWVLPSSELRRMEAPNIEKIYSKYGVDLILTGSVQHMGSTRAVSLSLMNGSDGRQLKTVNLTIDAEKLFEAQTDIRMQVMQLLGWQLPKQLAEQFAARKPSFDGAYKYYLEGKGYLYRFDQAGNNERAMDSFNRAIEIDPDFASAYVGLAETQLKKYYETKELDSLNLVSQTIKELSYIDEKNPLLYYLEAKFNLESGDYQNAKVLFQKSIAVNQYFLDAYLGLSDAYLFLLQNEEAEKVLIKAYELMPNNVSSLYYIGVFYFQVGKYQKAIEYFYKLLVQTPNNYIAFLNVSACYYLMGDVHNAIETIKKSIEIHPEADSLSNLGTMYFSLGNYDKAISAYEKMISINDSDYLKWGNLADAYLLSDNKKSQEAFKKALDLGKKALVVNPNNRNALASLSYYAANLELFDESLKYARQITKNDNGANNFLVAISYNVLGMTDMALEHIQYSVEQNYSMEEISNSVFIDSLKSDYRFQKIINNK